MDLLKDDCFMCLEVRFFYLHAVNSNTHSIILDLAYRRTAQRSILRSYHFHCSGANFLEPEEYGGRNDPRGERIV